MYKLTPEMKISQDVFWEFLKYRRRFTYKELEDEIRRRGGSLKIHPFYDSLKEFLQHYVEDDILSYDSKKNIFYLIENGV